MQSQARAVGRIIDTDIDVLVSTATSHVLLATINGFEDIVLNDTGLNEFDFGFAGVAGIEGLPDGYYRLHYLIDLTRPDEAMVFLSTQCLAYLFLAISDKSLPRPERKNSRPTETRAKKMPSHSNE